MPLPPRDITSQLGSDESGIGAGDFRAPTDAEWESINSRSAASNTPEPSSTKDGNDEDDAGDLDTNADPINDGKSAEAAPEAKADDPDITLPDGSTMKVSEILALKAGKAPAQPATPAAPAQTVEQQMADLARERQEFKLEQEKHRQGIEEILKDPAKYKQLQQEAGFSAEPHPVKDQQKWLQHRFNEYLKVGWKPEEVTREKLMTDLAQAVSLRTGRDLEQMQSAMAAQKLEVEDRKAFDSVTKELEGLYARPEFAHAATPEGREMVDALLAQADRDGRDVDLTDMVRKAHEFGVRLIEKYVGAKKADAKATGSLMRGGGSHRAPEEKDYGTGFDSFNRMARDRVQNGG